MLAGARSAIAFASSELRRRRFASGAKAFGFSAKKLCGANKEILDKESTIF
jgi:hypothetical protein